MAQSATQEEHVPWAFQRTKYWCEIVTRYDFLFFFKALINNLWQQILN